MKGALGDAAFSKRLAEFGAQSVAADRIGPDGFAAYFRCEVANGRR